MTLKFEVREDMSGYSLHVGTAQTNIEVGASENELRRLMIDLMHEFEIDDQALQTESALSTDGKEDE